MTSDEFWSILAEARAHLAADDREHASLGELLVDVLRVLPREAITGWDLCFWKLMASAYRWDLWGVSELVNEHEAEPGFVAFRSWLIGRGREAYEAALADPDAMAEWLPRGARGEVIGRVDGESIMNAPRRAYVAAFEQELPTATLDLFRAPRGEPVRDSELTTTYPKVAAALGL